MHDIVIEALKQTDISTCEVIVDALKDGETKRIPCGPGTVGNIVKIRQNATKAVNLILCEVEVYGKQGKVPGINLQRHECNVTAVLFKLPRIVYMSLFMGVNKIVQEAGLCIVFVRNDSCSAQLLAAVVHCCYKIMCNITIYKFTIGNDIFPVQNPLD